MGHHTCCVINCNNNGKNSNYQFYSFPQAFWKREQRMKWILAVKRKNPDGSQWFPKPHTKICSAHFIGGKKSDEQNSPSYVPTIFPSVKGPRRSKRQIRIPANMPEIQEPISSTYEIMEQNQGSKMIEVQIELSSNSEILTSANRCPLQDSILSRRSPQQPAPCVPHSADASNSKITNQAVPLQKKPIPRICYFGCQVEGALHRFPQPDKDMERFATWKTVLDGNDIKEKDDLSIFQSIKLCNRHFEDNFILPSKRLACGAVPTKNLKQFVEGMEWAEHLRVTVKNEVMDVDPLSMTPTDIHTEVDDNMTSDVQAKNYVVDVTSVKCERIDPFECSTIQEQPDDTAMQQTNGSKTDITPTSGCTIKIEPVTTPERQQMTKTLAGKPTTLYRIPKMAVMDDITKNMLKKVEDLKSEISAKDARIKSLEVLAATKDIRIKSLEERILTHKKKFRKMYNMQDTINQLKKQILSHKALEIQQNPIEEQLKELSLPAREFIEMQFMKKIKDNNRRYSTQAKMLALAIHKASPACYKLLSKYFVLPSRPVLIHFTSEIRETLTEQSNTDQTINEAEETINNLKIINKTEEAVSNLNEASEQVGDVATDVPEPRPEQVLRITGPTRLHLSDGSVAELAAGVVVELGDGDCVQLASGHVVQFAHGQLVEVNRFDLMQSNDIDDNQPDENVNTIANNETNVDQTEERKSQDTDFKLECDIESFEPQIISEAEVKLEKCAELKTQPIVDEFKIQNTTKTYQRKRPNVNETDSNGREIKKIIIQINDQTRPSTGVSSHQRKRPKVKESESNEREIKKIIIKVNDEQSGPSTDVSGVRGYDMPQLDRLMDLG